MYRPRAFQVDDLATLHAFVHQYGFGTLVSERDGAMTATHLPMLLDATTDGRGTLLGHLARANEQWREFDGKTQCLTIFQGPHGYISPSWYVSEPNVPTWNYAVVHAYGAPRVIDDAAALTALVERLAATYESVFPEPWTVRGVPTEYIERLLKGIVGFEMPIARIEGKFKMNQNRAEADQRGVIEALEGSGREADRELAAFMRNGR